MTLNSTNAEEGAVGSSDNDVLEERERPSEKEDGSSLTMGAKVLMYSRILYCMACLCLIVGPITGPQALYTPLMKRGLYIDECLNRTAAYADPCAAQEHAVENMVDVILSVCNMGGIVFGLVIDVYGAQTAAALCLSIWTVAKSVAGFHPENGHVWAAGESISAAAGLGIYTAVCLIHLKSACLTPGRYNFYSFVASAMWDFAVLFNIPLAYLYGWSQVTLWQAYLIYGLCIGGPAVLGALVWNPQKESQALAAAVAASSGVFETPWDRTKRKVRNAGRHIFTTFAFWLFTLHVSMIIALGYFLIANVRSIAAETFGATHDEQTRVAHIATGLMSGFGLTGMIPGTICQRLGSYRGLRICFPLKGFFAALTLAMLMIRNEWAMYIGYSAMFTWRVWGFGVAFPFLYLRFSAHADSLGFAFSLATSCGGLLSLGGGAVASRLLHSDPHQNYRPIVGVLCSIAVAVDLMLYVVVSRLGPVHPRTSSTKLLNADGDTTSLLDASV